LEKGKQGHKFQPPKGKFTIPGESSTVFSCPAVCQFFIKENNPHKGLMDKLSSTGWKINGVFF